ncbi:MAG: hypothetical protein AABW72_02970 [archaeon]
MPPRLPTRPERRVGKLPIATVRHKSLARMPAISVSEHSQLSVFHEIRGYIAKKRVSDRTNIPLSLTEKEKAVEVHLKAIANELEVRLDDLRNVGYHYSNGHTNQNIIVIDAFFPNERKNLFFICEREKLPANIKLAVDSLEAIELGTSQKS